MACELLPVAMFCLMDPKYCLFIHPFVCVFWEWKDPFTPLAPCGLALYRLIYIPPFATRIQKNFEILNAQQLVFFSVCKFQFNLLLPFRCITVFLKLVWGSLHIFIVRCSGSSTGRLFMKWTTWPIQRQKTLENLCICTGGHSGPIWAIMWSN